MLSAVLFDMDGLLVDSETLSYEIFRELAAEKGFQLTREQYCTLIGQSQDVCTQKLDRLLPGCDGADLYRKFHPLFFQAIQSGRLQLKPGALELLDACEARGIKKAVVSSNLESYVRNHLNVTGVADRFDAIVHDGMAAQAKPAPDLFLKGAQLLGVQNPADCLVLEDSYAGVRAGHAAGMRVIVVPDMIEPNEEILSMCLCRANNLHEVAGMLDSL